MNGNQVDLLPPLPITQGDKIRCLKREIALRERVYPKWVANGTMSDAGAKREIAVMKAVLHDYEPAPAPGPKAVG